MYVDVVTVGSELWLPVMFLAKKNITFRTMICYGQKCTPPFFSDAKNVMVCIESLVLMVCIEFLGTRNAVVAGNMYFL